MRMQWRKVSFGKLFGAASTSLVGRVKLAAAINRNNACIVVLAYFLELFLPLNLIFLHLLTQLL